MSAFAAGAEGWERLAEPNVKEQDPGNILGEELLRRPMLALPAGVVGIDAGMTLVKIARTTEEGIVLESRETTVDPRATGAFAGEHQSVRIGVTGARAGDVADDGRTVRVQEIDAAAHGVSALLAAEERLASGEFVMALLGTGTAFAAVRGEKVSHLGGTPLGGGSFTGIARRIDPALSYAAMIARASRGDRRHVDAMISDVYPEGIGRVGPDLTAAHLSKAGGSPDDVLAGLLNLHGENIAQIGASRAIIANIRRIVLAGGFAHGNPALVSSITSMAALFGVSVEVSPAPGFAGAIGAALAAAARA
jgi:type II pantothenate kinase